MLIGLDEDELAWARPSRTAVKLSRSEILTALKRAGRKRLVDEWAERISSEQLRLSAVLQHAYASSVRSLARVIAVRFGGS